MWSLVHGMFLVSTDKLVEILQLSSRKPDIVWFIPSFHNLFPSLGVEVNFSFALPLLLFITMLFPYLLFRKTAVDVQNCYFRCRVTVQHGKFDEKKYTARSNKIFLCHKKTMILSWLSFYSCIELKNLRILQVY